MLSICFLLFSCRVALTFYVPGSSFLFSGTMMAAWGTLCPLIAKLPQRKRSNDSHDERRLLKERQALEDIITVAWHNPRKRLDMLHAMKLELEAPDPDQEDQQREFTFKVPPPTLGQVDAEWVAAYLTQRYPLLSESILGKIKAADIHNMRNVFHNDLHASATLRLPASCQDKRVLKDMCEARTTEVGRRMEITVEVVEKIWDQRGHVPWGMIGPFAIKLEKGEAPQALHRPTNTLVHLDSDLGVQNGGWALDKKWSDTKCVIEKGPGRKHRMLDFFLKHTKPWSVTQWSATVKGLVEKCDGIAEEYESKEAQLKVSGVADMGEAFSTPSKTQNSERLAKARKSSEASRDERASKRKCLLVDALVMTPEPKKAKEVAAEVAAEEAKVTQEVEGAEDKVTE